tara:strand:- start:188539 stop:188706 length:168 start_codon:yes stop_codon:yes gene_type:complete
MDFSKKLSENHSFLGKPAKSCGSNRGKESRLIGEKAVLLPFPSRDRQHGSDDFCL